jgi:hypothetical protein
MPHSPHSLNPGFHPPFSDFGLRGQNTIFSQILGSGEISEVAYAQTSITSTGRADRLGQPIEPLNTPPKGASASRKRGSGLSENACAQFRLINRPARRPRRCRPYLSLQLQNHPPVAGAFHQSTRKCVRVCAPTGVGAFRPLREYLLPNPRESVSRNRGEKFPYPPSRPKRPPKLSEVYRDRAKEGLRPWRE